jgi:NAD(P)-dependent dehydrogenase (short-subunit alcohol dehydrogenase family)
MHKFRLDGRLALVTGASSGIGRHCAALLASMGADVAIASRRVDKLHSLQREIPGDVRPFALDVTDSANVKLCFDQIHDSFGSPPEIVINNAGVAVTKHIFKQDEEDWDFVMDTNLKGHFLVATEAARRLVRAKKPGSIVNIASILGYRQTMAVTPYAISKAGVIQGTKSMALELARHSIRVNALAPGYVVTDINREYLEGPSGDKLRERIPSRKFLSLSDLDGPLLLLASDAGSAMTGSVLTVDYGHSVSSL